MKTESGTMVVVNELKSRSIDTKKFGEQFNAIVQVMTSLNAPSGGYKIDQMSIGLAVSAGGDIGLVKAGLQASIQVVLKPKQ